VTFAAVARIGDQAVLARYVDRSAAASEAEVAGYDKAMAELLQKAGRLPAYPGWTGSVAAAGAAAGNVHALADPQALCVLVVAIRAGYPERLVRPLLQELAEKVRATESAERLSEAQAGKLTGTLRSCLKEVVRTYNEPGKLDKVTAAHEKVDKIKDLMHDNVRKILETHGSLETLQAKSTSMTASADKFLKQSSALKHQLQMRNLRVKAIMALCSGALLTYVLMPLFG